MGKDTTWGRRTTWLLVIVPGLILILDIFRGFGPNHTVGCFEDQDLVSCFHVSKVLWTL